MTINALTVDVEDYFQVSAFATVVRRSDWDKFESRVVQNTHRILRLFDEYHVRATFFVLGWVADRFPSLVRDIQQSGHEIGCHSFWHRLVYTQSPEEFREDLLQGCKVIEEITGEPVTAYRAPSFSITKKSLWALEILAEESIAVDSSIYPIRHDLYGIPNADPQPHKIETPAGTLLEVPGTVSRMFGVNIPVGGGGYFRFVPYLVTKGLLSRLNGRMSRPFVFYIHPWEIDPDQPRISGSSQARRFRHYNNLKKTEPRLRRLLSDYRFGTLSEMVDGSGIRRQVSQTGGPQFATTEVPVDR